MEDASGYAGRNDVCPFAGQKEAPEFVHQGNACLVRWPEPFPESFVKANFEIAYSFERDGDRISVERRADSDAITIVKD
jgi:hypothetical protein